jgi:hypothetical protein
MDIPAACVGWFSLACGEHLSEYTMMYIYMQYSVFSYSWLSACIGEVAIFDDVKVLVSHQGVDT